MATFVKVRAGRRPERLAQLAREAGVEQSTLTFHLTRPPLPAITAAEATTIQDALTKAQISKFQSTFKGMVLKSNPARLSHDVVITTALLQSRVHAGCSAGEALCLIKLGANVNFIQQKNDGFMRKVRKKEQEDVRNDVVQRAAERGDSTLVNVLVDKADQVSLDSGLAAAIARTDIEVIKILLVAGADPNTCQLAFRQAVQSSNSQLVGCLCNGLVKMNKDTIRKELHQAAQHGQLDTVRILLGCLDSMDVIDSAILALAVRYKKTSIVAALCMAPRLPVPADLAANIKLIENECKDTSSQSYKILELLLAAGAKGKEVSAALVRLLAAGSIDAARLITQYVEFDVKNTGDAMKNAITKDATDVFELLLELTNSTITLDAVLDFLHAKTLQLSIDRRKMIVSSLIKRGCSKTALSKALCDAVETNEGDIVRSLIEHGASVDHDSGRPLVTTVKRQSLALFCIVIEGKPSLKTLQAAMKPLSNLSLALRVVMTEILVNKGVKGPEVDAALVTAVKNHNGTTNSYRLIELLVNAKAVVNVNEGGSLVLVIRRVDVRAVAILVRNLAPLADLEVAFSAALQVKDFESRFSIVRMLLTAGARGVMVTNALINVLDGSPGSQKMSRLLASEGRPDVDLFDGRVVVQAVSEADVELVRSLLRCKPAQNTLSDGLREAMKLDDRQIRLEMCRLLLQTDAKGEALNEAVIRATLSIPCDTELIQLFVKHKASVDHDSGRALQIAIKRRDVELLSLLLQRPILVATRIQALSEALTLKVEDQRVAFVDRLLKTNTFIPPATLGAIIVEAFGASEDTRVLQILIDKGASVNIEPLEAFQKAIKLNNKNALKALMNGKPTSATIKEVFNQAWEVRQNHGIELLRIVSSRALARQYTKTNEYLLTAVREVPPATQLIEILLDFDLPDNELATRSVYEAASRLNNEILQILLRRLKKRIDVSSLMAKLMTVTNIWKQPAGARTVEILLDCGISQSDIDNTLTVAVKKYRSDPNAPDILTALVSHNANADHFNGWAMELAVQDGNLDAVQTLLKCQPSAKTINSVFPWIFKSNANEATILQLMKMLADSAQDKFNPDKEHDILEPALFLCLQRKPMSMEILQRLLVTGSSIHKRISGVVRADCSSESMTTLLWTVCNLEINLACAVSKLLIKYGANINFISGQSKTSPLLAAVLGSRVELVKVLLEFKADPAIMDHTGRTPLCYAAGRGDLNLMQLLIRSGAPINDGSLHEAAFNLCYDATVLLLNEGHDPNLPSPVHELQVPLQTIIKYSEGQSKPGNITAIFDLLQDYGANVQCQLYSKNLLFMALDAPHAAQIVAPVLNAEMYCDVGHVSNMYLAEDNMIYSPLAYVMHDKQKSPLEQKNTLVKILQSYGCEDISYPIRDQHPAGGKTPIKDFIEEI